MAVYSLTSVDTAKKWHIMLIEQILGWFLEAAITIINDYLKENTYTQCELMIALFNSFYDDNPDYAFEKTTVNKWIKGVLPVPVILKQYYQDPVKAEDIGTDFENIVHKHIIVF